MADDDARLDSVDDRADGGEQQSAKSGKKRYRKDKPWDNENIDHWKIDPVTAEDPLPAPLEESSFATLFPSYREKYIREVWPLVTRTLKQYGIACELDLIEGSMTVKTTRKTWDPFIIIKARDMLKLLARSIPVQQAMKVLEDEMYCDIIKIKHMVRNKERFVKRRQRLIGPNGCTLKAIELVTGCYVMVQGNTVSAMGSVKGLKQVRRLVEDCMKNVHPIYNIKQLMIKKELAKNDKLKDENWDRFLPQFKKKNVQRRKPKVINKKEAYTPFPPAQQPRKVDLQLESGEYFLSEAEKRKKAEEERREKSQKAKKERMQARASEFEAPEEPSTKKQKSDEPSKATKDVDLESLKTKFKAAKSKQSAAEQNAEDYVMAPVKPKKRAKTSDQ